MARIAVIFADSPSLLTVLPGCACGVEASTVAAWVVTDSKAKSFSADVWREVTPPSGSVGVFPSGDGEELKSDNAFPAESVCLWWGRDGSLPYVLSYAKRADFGSSNENAV